MKQYNAFLKGLVDDLAYNHVKQDNWVFPTHGIRIYNKKGQGYIVSAELGNVELFSTEIQSYTEGYTIITAEEHRGIIYIVSVKEIAGEWSTTFGCYPYPTAWKDEVVKGNVTGFEQTYGILRNYADGVSDTQYMQSILFGYNTASNLKLIIDDAFDESINMYLCDGANTDKVLNSGFLPDGSINDVLYHVGDFEGKLNHILFSLNPVTITDVSVPIGGVLPPGQYHIFFAYKTASYDKTEYFSESFPISVAEGDTVVSVHGETDTKSDGTKNKTRKKIVLSLSDIDQDYKYLSVAMIRFFSDDVGDLQHEQMEVATDNIINGPTLTIEITGNEDMIISTTDDLYNTSLQERISKDHCFLNSRIWKTNLTSVEYDKTIFTSLALLVTIESDKIDDMPYTGYNDIVHNSNTTKLIYQDPDYIYHKLSYFENEVYPFGITFFLNNGITTDTYSITGRNEDVPGVPNSEGLFKFKRDSDRRYIIGAKFFIRDLLDAIVADPDTYGTIVGFNITRGERIKNMLYDGVLERTANGVRVSKNRKTYHRKGVDRGGICWYYNREQLWFGAEEESNAYHMPVFRYGHSMPKVGIDGSSYKVSYPRVPFPISNYYTFPHATYNDNGNDKSNFKVPVPEFLIDFFGLKFDAGGEKKGVYEYSIAVENPAEVADSNDTEDPGDNNISDILSFSDAIDTKLNVSDTNFAIFSPDFMTEIDHLTESGESYFMKIYDAYSGTQYSEGSYEYESERDDGNEFAVLPSRTRVYELVEGVNTFDTAQDHIIELLTNGGVSTIITDSSGDVWIYCTHNKDATDLTSIWADSAANQWVLDVVEVDRLRFSENAAHGFAMPTAPDTLTHISGASHTTDINYTNSLSVAEWTAECPESGGTTIPLPSIAAWQLGMDYFISGTFSELIAPSSVLMTPSFTGDVIISHLGAKYICIVTTVHANLDGLDSEPHINYYRFVIPSSAFAQDGATYQDTALNTYVVQSSGSLFLSCSSGVPPIATDTLTKTGGVGSNTIVYTSFTTGGQYWVMIDSIVAYKREFGNYVFTDSILITEGYVRPVCTTGTYNLPVVTLDSFVQEVRVYNIDKGTYKGEGKFSSYAEDGKEYQIKGKKGMYSLTGYMMNGQFKVNIWSGLMGGDLKSQMVHYNRSYQTPGYIGIVPIIHFVSVTFVTHDKDSTDLESIWEDSDSNQWKFEEVVSSSVLKFSRSVHHDDMPVATDTLTHVSGGTHTANIVYTVVADGGINIGDTSFGTSYSKSGVRMVKIYKTSPDTEDFFDDSLATFDPKYEQYWNISNLIKVNSAETHETVFKGDNFKTISWFRMAHQVDFDDNQWDGHQSKGFQSWYVSGDNIDLVFRPQKHLRSAYFLDKSYHHGILYGMLTSNRHNVSLRSKLRIVLKEGENTNEVNYTFFPNVAEKGDPFGWIYSSSDESDLVESLNINGGYNYVEGFRKSIGVDINLPYDSKDRKTAIAFSDRRVVNSYADGYRSMKAVNSVDFETNFGEIMRIEELYGMLVTIRKEATLKHFIGQKKITEDLTYDTSAIYLSEETLPMLYYGIQDWHAFIKTKSALYAVDVNHSMIIRITMETTAMDANKLAPALLSKVFMVEKKTKELTEMLATVRTTSIERNGISIGYNEDYGEVHFSFFNGEIMETLVFSEDKKFFIGTSPRTAALYTPYKKGLLSSMWIGHKDMDIMYENDIDVSPILFYGSPVTNKLSFIVNGYSEEENSVILTKIFESLSISSPHEVLTKILYETELQKGEYTFTEDSAEFWKDSEWVEGSWLVPIIRENIADSDAYYEDDSILRGRWLKITLEFVASNNFYITEIITEFKQSFS